MSHSRIHQQSGPKFCVCTAWNAQAHVNTNYHLHIGRQNYKMTHLWGSKKKKRTVSHLNTHVLHHELLSITPSARLQSQASCFWWGEGERWRSRTLSQRHGSLRAGNDRLGKLVSVIILIMLIAAISTPAVMSQRQRHDWTALTRSVLKKLLSRWQTHTHRQRSCVNQSLTDGYSTVSVKHTVWHVLVTERREIKGGKKACKPETTLVLTQFWMLKHPPLLFESINTVSQNCFNNKPLIAGAEGFVMMTFPNTRAPSFYAAAVGGSVCGPLHTAGLMRYSKV